MARITIEDCMDDSGEIENPFELVLIATERAKEIIAGDNILTDQTNRNDKETVSALREIAENKLNIADLKLKIKKRLTNYCSTIEEEDKKYLNKADDSFNKIE